MLPWWNTQLAPGWEWAWSPSMWWHPVYTAHPPDPTYSAGSPPPAPGLEENKGGRSRGTSEGKGGGRGKDEGKGGRSRGASEGKGGGRSRGKSEGKNGGRGRGKGDGGGKNKYPPLPEAPAGVELPGSWLEHFPHGHYMECTWPVTKAKYPAKEERASWTSHETIADEYSCVVKLGGQADPKALGAHPCAPRGEGHPCGAVLPRLAEGEPPRLQRRLSDRVREQDGPP